MENEGHQEETEIRLESDDNLVQIVSMHSSKGLEYPLVFCVSLWEPSLKRAVFSEDTAAIRYLNNGHTAVLAGKKNSDTEKDLIGSTVAERIRLAYVALTRAQERCYIPVPPFSGEFGDSSPLVYLLFGEQKALSKGNSLGPEKVLAAIEEMAARFGDRICLRSRPDFDTFRVMVSEAGTHGTALRIRQPLKQQPDWRMFSYSSLKKRSEKSYEPEQMQDTDTEQISLKLSDEEITDDILPVVSAFSSISAFPGGAEAGTFMHRIFEELDFVRFETDAMPLIVRCLQEDGYDERWAEAVYKMLVSVLEKRLPGSGARLAEKGTDEAIDEMEFYFSLNHADPDAVKKIIAGDVPSAASVKEEGFMNGFIDLIFEHDGRFYILDYKSDNMGQTNEDYSPPRLAEVMKDRGYVMQYHIYLVALRRFLQQKLGDAFRYEEHIGGVYYLFLRGIQPGDSENGIYRDNPRREIIERLDEWFKGDSNAD
jgi:exodeoxyribonuclease V beta subunit